MRDLSAASWHRLAPAGDRSGLSCDEHGAFLGETPLLECASTEPAGRHWRPRAIAALNAALGSAYGLPVDLTVKADGIGVIARALNAGSVALAQIATLQLRLPPLPRLEKRHRSVDDLVDLAMSLRNSRILDEDAIAAEPVGTSAKRDVSGEPRIPRGQLGGGQWTDGGGGTQGRSSPIQLAQEVIPLPWDTPLIRPMPGARPMPPDVIRPLPPDLAPPVPNVVPRDAIPQNPYPDRPECEEEWREATKRCLDLWLSGKMGKRGYRGFGDFIGQCIRGQVSEACGGNPTA